MDKKYTAKEAAEAVLKKAEEMLKSSKVADYKRAQSSKEKGVHKPANKDAPVYHQEGMSSAGSETRSAKQTKARGVPDSQNYSRASAVGKHKAVLSEIKAMPKPNLTKGDIQEKDQTPADGVQKETIGQHDPAQGKENSNPVWGTEPGCHKLSKFMGRKEEKSKAKSQVAPIDKAETGHEKGINTSTDPKAKSRVMMGTSKNGSQLPSKDTADINEAKDGQKQVLNQMKAMPKPNLPKEGK